MNSTPTDETGSAAGFSYPDPDPVAYQAATPFPHGVFEGAWPVGLLQDCKRDLSTFEDWDGEKNFFGSRKKRFCGQLDRLPTSVRKVITQAGEPRFLQWLERLTGETSLSADPTLQGGGVHQISAGGYLKIHADFNWNTQLNLYRRLNVLLYLNEGWQSEWGGELELWRHDMSRCEKKVSPALNTMVVFTTDDQSFHGHPHPLSTPAGVSRDSIALYYYSSVRPTRNFASERITTDYRRIAGDTFKTG